MACSRLMCNPERTHLLAMSCMCRHSQCINNWALTVSRLIAMFVFAPTFCLSFLKVQRPDLSECWLSSCDVYRIRHPFAEVISSLEGHKTLLCSCPPAWFNLRIESLYSILLGLIGNGSLRSIWTACSADDAAEVSLLSVKWILDGWWGLIAF